MDPEFKNQPFMEIVANVLETGESYVGNEVLVSLSKIEDRPAEDRYYDFVYVRINDSEGRPYGVLDHASPRSASRFSFPT